MQPQQYSNHAKYYPAHHFVLYPISLIGTIFCVREIFNQPDRQKEWIIISLLWLMIIFLAFMLRQHYGLGNQNRIIRMEMRFRYYVLTKQRLEELEDKLSFAQIAALRFASDEALPALVRRAVNENLLPAEIKKSVKDWQADHMRV